MPAHIWIITGPAGCGKTTVASGLADSLHLPFIEGDEGNIDKMARGVPLNDADRWDWLIMLRQQALLSLQQADTEGVVVTCSALKAKYRDVLRVAALHDPRVKVYFVYLRATEDQLIARVRARQGHFMKDAMVHSQFSSLEEPLADEHDCFVVDVGAGTLPEVQVLVLAAVQRALAPLVGNAT